MSKPARLGSATVLPGQGATVVVRRGDRFESCLTADRTGRLTVGEALANGQRWSSAACR